MNPGFRLIVLKVKKIRLEDSNINAIGGNNYYLNEQAESDQRPPKEWFEAKLFPPAQQPPNRSGEFKSMREQLVKDAKENAEIRNGTSPTKDAVYQGCPMMPRSLIGLILMYTQEDLGSKMYDQLKNWNALHVIATSMNSVQYVDIILQEPTLAENFGKLLTNFDSTNKKRTPIALAKEITGNDSTFKLMVEKVQGKLAEKSLAKVSELAAEVFAPADNIASANQPHRLSF